MAEALFFTRFVHVLVILHPLHYSTKILPTYLVFLSWHIQVEYTLVISTAPEEILYEVGKRQIHYPLEQVINQLLPLDSISAGAHFQTLDDRIHFGLTGPLLNHHFELLV